MRRPIPREKQKQMRIKAIHITGVLFMFFGLLVTWESRKLKYWAEFGPGPGFFPLWLGIVICITAFFILYQTFRQEGGNVEKERFFAGWEEARRPIFAAAAFSAFIFLVRFTGFYIGAAFFIAFIVGFVERRSWVTVAAVTILSLAAFFYVFDYLLQVQLPVAFFSR